MFASSFVRKLAYIAAALLVANLIGHKAHATTFVYPAGPNGLDPVNGQPQFGSGSAFCSWIVSRYLASGTTETITSITGGGAGAPTSTGVTAVCNLSPAQTAGSTSAVAGSMSCSTGSGNLDLLTTLAGASGYTAGGGICYNGCEYLNGNSTVQVITTKNFIAGAAAPSGIACGLAGSNAHDATAVTSNCVVQSGSTACASSASGSAVIQNTNTGTFSVVVPNVPSTPNTCISYADGGAACNAGTSGAGHSPPAPSTSTDPSTAVSPDATVTQTGVSSNVVNYYGPVKVAASKGPVLTVSSTTGTPQGTTAATGTGTGTSGTGPSAANGDCGATGVNCTGDETTPDLTRSDTIQSNVQSYLDSIKSSPLFSALTTVSTSWPSGSCPSTPFTVFGKDVDFMASACTIWTTDVATPLGYVFLAIWAIWGIRVVLTA